MKKIGVLALQGDFAAHERAFRAEGAETLQVRTADQLAQVDALAMPGGESTAMLRLLHAGLLFEPLRDFCRRKPVFATCAGVILLAQQVENPQQESLGILDLTVERNAYGRQVDSAIVRLEPEPVAAAEALGSEVDGRVEAVFIRAPIIRRVGPAGTVLLRYQKDPVLVDFGQQLVATFHPELSTDYPIQRLFLSRL